MENILKNSLFFKSFRDDQIKKIIKVSRINSFIPGQNIFFEGDEAPGLYIVKSGKVKIFKMSPEGKEQILHIFGTGEPFGEVALFAGVPFPANAQAIEKLETIFIPRTEIIKIFSQDPSTAMSIIAVLSLRLKEFTKLIEDLTLKELPERLASYILQQNKAQGDNNQIILEFSKGQLSKILGSSQEALSRTLTRFSKAGIIDTDKRNIKIVDRNLLEDISQGLENIKNIDNKL